MNHLFYRDLFHKNFKELKLTNAGQDYYKRCIEVFEKLKAEGEAILRYKDNLIEPISLNSHRGVVDGFDVPFVNAPFFQSELANMLSENESFAVAYYFNGEKYRVSLRSREEGEDVSSIATKFGGGGHKRAAAFSVDSIDAFIKALEDE